jgi:hypothetical protein
MLEVGQIMTWHRISDDRRRTDEIPVKIVKLAKNGIIPCARRPRCRQKVRVWHGDTLSGIAGTHYRDEEYWPLIWDHNRGKIGLNPNRIQEGTLLELPQLSSFSPAERNDAKFKRRHKTWTNFAHGPKHPHGGPIKVAPLR